MNGTDVEGKTHAINVCYLQAHDVFFFNNYLFQKSWRVLSSDFLSLCLEFGKYMLLVCKSNISIRQKGSKGHAKIRLI